MPKDLAYYETNRKLSSLTEKLINNSVIDKELYAKYDVKRGLRDLDGKGVRTGLTDISEIVQNKVVDGKTVPCDGQLFYRGYNINDVVEGFSSEGRFGFEEVVYLLLFGEMPNKNELSQFTEMLGAYRTLPTNFVRDVIMKAPSADMMNTLARSVLTLYCYDSNPNDTSIENVLRQSMQLISVFPLLSVYGYQAYNHYLRNQSLYIHVPDPKKSTAEIVLTLLRPDQKYTDLEARVLDMALVLHAEHGGGNNSSFTTHVVTSSGTDTYSAISAALCSLKGPKHGGANVRVSKMFEDLKINVQDWADDEQIEKYLGDILDKKAYDRSGLIYGMGHAVYSISDPRARILKSFTEKLAIAKGLEDEYNLYRSVERLAPKVIGEKKKIYKGVSANVDFYSGFIYNMLNLPTELYTPLFAIARIAGWSAHRMEELINGNKIIRPAYMSISAHKEYKKLDER
ncbi:MAG: citrate/2-methylcitrate synthase [Ruminococcus sp.]|nr:citrate/2-methylcitrate synthase [Ruminococcus sp.]